MLLELVVHLVRSPSLWSRDGSWSGRGSGRLSLRRRVVQEMTVADVRLLRCLAIDCLVIGWSVVGNLVIGRWCRVGGGLRRGVVPVSHDVGKHRVVVETVGPLPTVGIVHV